MKMTQCWSTWMYLMRAALMRTWLCAACLPGLLMLAAPAQAACTLGACVSAGPRLASVDSARGTLLNALVGNLLGSNINLTVADWNALAAGNINLIKFAQALQTQTSASTPSTALAANATLAQVLSAAATAAQADGQTAAASALGQSVAQIGALSGTVRLADMLTVNLPEGALATGSLNALELLSGTAQLYNTRNVLTTPTPVALSGNVLGLSGLSVGQVQLYVQAVEPPVYVCGDVGSTFHTATIRLKLNVSLASLDLGASGLNGLGGISGVSAQLGQLQLYVEVARAEGTIAAIDTMARALTVQATPGVVDLYLGNIDDTVFFNRSHVLNATTDLTYANVGSLTANLGILGTLTVAIQAKASARGQTPGVRTLSFNAPFPQTRTASTSITFVSDLLSALLANLSLSLQPSLGTTVDALVLAPLATLVGNTVSPVLSGLLGGVADPLLADLGIGLGEIDVTADGASRLCALMGYAYKDANHNGSRDGAEAGCGLPLYAKLVLASSPAGPALFVSAVDPSTGRYDFTGVPSASYTLLIDTNGTTSDVTPTYPSGWLGTEAPTFSRTLTLGSDVDPQNFGLFNGSRVSGTVFSDTGTGGGTANDGTQQGGEKGVSGATMQAFDNGGTLLDSAVTGASGTYTLWVPASVGAAPVKISETNTGGYVSIQAQPGNSGGSYDRPTDTITFNNAIGLVYTGLNFADVPDNTLTDDGQQNILPGAVAYYPHTFTAGSAGQLTLATALNPGTPWVVTLYVDSNCNTVLDAGDVPWSGSLNMVSGQKVCLLVKVSSPPGGAPGTQQATTLSATYAYTQASLSRALTRSDTTLLGPDTAAGLRLFKSVDKASAKTGDVLTYTITFTNQSKDVLTNLRLNDVTPIYTVFASAACGAPLPTGITQCTLSHQPAAGVFGNIEWTLTGALQPGASGQVSFAVTVQ